MVWRNKHSGWQVQGRRVKDKLGELGLVRKAQNRMHREVLGNLVEKFWH